MYIGKGNLRLDYGQQFIKSLHRHMEIIEEFLIIAPQIDEQRGERAQEFRSTYRFLSFVIFQQQIRAD